MQLRVITNNGTESTLNCKEVLSVDGVAFSELSQGSKLNLDSLSERLTIAESALASMLEQWNEFMATAVIVDSATDGE